MTIVDNSNEKYDSKNHENANSGKFIAKKEGDIETFGLNENHTIQLNNLYNVAAETLNINKNSIDLYQKAVEEEDEVLLDTPVAIRSLGLENERYQRRRIVIIARSKQDRQED